MWLRLQPRWLGQKDSWQPKCMQWNAISCSGAPNPPLSKENQKKNLKLGKFFRFQSLHLFVLAWPETSARKDERTLGLACPFWFINCTCSSRCDNEDNLPRSYANSFRASFWCDAINYTFVLQDKQRANFITPSSRLEAINNCSGQRFLELGIRIGMVWQFLLGRVWGIA